MELSINIADLEGLDKAAVELLDNCKGYYCFAFQGQVGAGKTTFIKALCKQLGTIDAVASPTYALVNEYHTDAAKAQGKTHIYHIDLYRLKNTAEAEDIGLDDYLADTDAWCFIEWPELAGILLPDKIVRIFIYRNDDDSRTLRLMKP
jgi:tRNA threonylcarbamoyladenosine biosynthesis protein TsaE